MNKVRTAILCFVMLCAQQVQGQTWKELVDSARAYQQQGKMDKVEQFYLKANDILRRDSFWTETHGRVVNSLAGIYWRKGEFEKAGKYGEEALQVAEKILSKNHPFYATSCHNLGMVFSTLGEYEKSEMYYLEAKRVREKLFGKKNRDYASTCNTLGILYVDIGQYNLATQYYMEAKTIFSEVAGKKSMDYARSCINLATLYKRLGIYEKAEPLYLESMSTWVQLEMQSSADYASCCTNLASLYNLVAKSDKAEKLLLEARDIFARTIGKEHPDYAVNSHNLAGVFAENGQFGNAEKFYLEAGSIFEKANGKNHPDYAKNLNAIGFMYTGEKRFREAEKYFAEAREITEKVVGKDHPDYAVNNHDLASLYLRMGLYEKALPLFTEAKRIFQSTYGRFHPDYISSCESIAAIYIRLNNTPAALVEYKLALEAQEGLMQKVFMITSEAEKLSYIKRIRRLNNEIFSLKVSGEKSISGNFLYDLVLSSRNTLLEYNRQLRQVINNTGDTLVIRKYNDWINLREKISYAYSLAGTKRPVGFSAMEQKADEQEKELMRIFSETNGQTGWEKTVVSKLANDLMPEEAAVEFISFPYFNGDTWTDSIFYAALIVKKDQQQCDLVNLFEEKELTGLLKQHKGAGAGQVQINQLYSHAVPSKKEEQSSLYELVWKPLEEKLAGVKKIYFASAGSLFKISFAAIPVSSDVRLSDRYQLVQLNTTASLTNRKNHLLTGTDRLTMYGGVYYDVDSAGMRMAAMQSSGGEMAFRSTAGDFLREGVPEFKYLVGTEKEVTAVGKLAEKAGFAVSIHEGSNATEESFKLLSGKHSPAILHIATHGFFFPDPGVEKKYLQRGGRDAFRQSENPLFRSGLALSGANNAWRDKAVLGVQDGILTAYEVSNMYLPNTKLAVLSACETGLGDIQGSEGVYGLQRAFKIAGVENLVMSLWKVPDEETAEFMQQFYKNLFANQSIQDAFNNAQSAMKNKYRNDPYKWAAWVLIR